MTFRGKPISEINHAMKTLIPETKGCIHADYPMENGRWLKGNEPAPDGGLCYIRTENKLPADGPKAGFIWGTGPFGFGYYHLRTQNAYKLIFNRIQNGKVYVAAPADDWCPCFGSSTESDPRSQMPNIDVKDKDILRLLFHARSVSTTASDEQAQADQIAEGRATAQGLMMVGNGGADLIELGRVANQYQKTQEKNREQEMQAQKMNR